MILTLLLYEMIATRSAPAAGRLSCVGHTIQKIPESPQNDQYASAKCEDSCRNWMAQIGDRLCYGGILLTKW